MSQSNSTKPVLKRSSSVPTTSTISRLNRPELGSLARPSSPIDLAPSPALVQCRVRLMGKLSGDKLSSVKFRCGENGEISQSKVRSGYMPMADFTLFPRPEKTQEEKRTKSAQRYAIQRFNGTPNLSSACQILRDKLIVATNNNIFLAKRALTEQDKREARAQADSTTDKEAKRAVKEAKRQAELSEQTALLSSLRLTINPDFAAAHSAPVDDDEDDDDIGFPNYAAAYPDENRSGSTVEHSDKTGEEQAGE